VGLLGMKQWQHWFLYSFSSPTPLTQRKLSI
jgi:hypothetical protein